MSMRSLPPLFALMDERGIRNADLIALSGVGYSVISKLRKGDVASIPVGDVVLVAHALDVAPSLLVPGFDANPIGSSTARGDAKELRERIRSRINRKAELRKRGERLARERWGRAMEDFEAKAAATPQDGGESSAG